MHNLQMRLLLVLTFMFSATAAIGQKKTVFLITDAEGVGGVCRQDQTEPKDAELRQLLTGEINAAVDGFLAGGVDEVVVWDGHDGSQTLSTLTIHPKAKLVMGALNASMLMERKWSAVAYVGQHSKANVKGGVMAHSYSSLGIQVMKLNGKPVGEIDVIAGMAGQFGIPIIFLSGDKAAADELHEIVPNAELVVVKEGLARYVCISVSAPVAREMIREGARRSVGLIGKVKPYRVTNPVTLEIEYTTRNTLGLDAEARAGAEVVDSQKIRFKGKDLLEAWQRYRAR